MPARRARRSARARLAFVLLATAARGTAQAPNHELRTYLDVEYLVAKSGLLALRPFARAESRFRGSGLVYEQWNVGLRLRVRPWLSVATYYTPRELLYPGKPNAFKQVAGADVVLQSAIRQVRLLNRETEEWHSTDGFHRYRNFSEIAYGSSRTRLAPFVYDEFRADGDQGRINMNDVGIGIQLNATPTLGLRFSFDVEANRRLLPRWQYTQYVGLAVAAHL